MERHGYSDSDPEIRLSEIEIHHGRNEMIKLLGEFFYEVYGEELGQPHARKRAFDKASSLINEDFDSSEILTQFRYENGLEAAIKKAISYGYIWKIQIERPWHPKLFFNFDGIKTYPQQHEEVVLWTGQSKHLFFSDVGKIDLLQNKSYEEFNNPKSIFNQNGIKMGSRHDEKDKGTGADAIYLSHYISRKDAPDRDKAARHYANKREESLFDFSVVMEFRIPSDMIHIWDGNYSRDTDEGVFQELKSFRQNVPRPLQLLKMKDGKGRIEYQYRHEILFMDLCTGVLDLETDVNLNSRGHFPDKSNSYSFSPLEVYHEKIYSQFPFRVPWKINLTDQGFSKKKAKSLRQKKLDKIGFSEKFEDAVTYLRDLLEYAEDLADATDVSKDPVLAKIVQKNDIQTITYNRREFPRCHKIDGPSGWEDFVPSRAIDRREKKFLDFEKMYANPLNYEEVVRKKWEENDNTKYYSPLFSRKYAIPKITEEFGKFEVYLIDYCKAVIKTVLSQSNSKKLERKVRRIRKDIERTKKDVKAIKTM